MHGETVSDCVPAALSGSWQHLPVGTLVLSRKTNFSTIHIAYPQLHLADNEVVAIAPPTTERAAAVSCWNWSTPIQNNSSQQYLLDVAQLIGAIPEVGAFLTPFLSVFATSMNTSISWDDVFQMATCAAEQISKQNDVAILQGSISALGQEINDTYLPAKKAISGTTGDERVQAMDHANDIGVAILTDIRSNLGGLSSDDLGKEAAVAYVAGVSVVVGLYQDLSTVDSSVSQPGDSTYIQSMQQYAGEALTTIQSLVSGVVSDRGAAIYLTDIYDPKTACSGGNSPTCVQTGETLVGAYWEDDIAGSQSKNYTAKTQPDIDNEIATCTNDMKIYKSAILATLSTQLQPLIDAVTAMSQTPIPPPLPA